MPLCAARRCADEAERNRAARCRARRHAGLRRRSRLVPRKFQPAAFRSRAARTRPAGAQALRAGQPLVQRGRRAARPALPVAAAPAGQAGARGAGRGLRRGGRHPPRLAELRPLVRRRAERCQPPPAVGAGGFRARLRRPHRRHPLPLQDHRRLRAGLRTRDPLERPRRSASTGRCPTAARRRGWPTRTPPRRCCRPPRCLHEAPALPTAGRVPHAQRGRHAHERAGRAPDRRMPP